MSLDPEFDRKYRIYFNMPFTKDMFKKVKIQTKWESEEELLDYVTTYFEEIFIENNII
jgi:hypothetical protein